VTDAPLRPTLLAPAYWPEVRRGTERALRLLADGLRDAGHRPRLLCGHPGTKRRATVEDGLEVVRLPRPAWARTAIARGRIDEHAAHLPALLRELAADPGDLLHAHYPTDAVAAALARRYHAARGRRVPLIVANMGPPDRRWAGERRGRTTGLVTVARRADAVTTLSAFAHDRVLRELGVASLVLPPPVDLDAFTPPEVVRRDDAANRDRRTAVEPVPRDPDRHDAAAGRASRAPAPTILFASAPDSAAKRLELLLEAFALLRADRTGARLQVQRPADPAHAAWLAGRPGVTLVDLDDALVLRDAYRRAWVTALPSRDEAFGLVVAESLACGTPAVACAGEGPAEVIASDAVGRIAAEPTPTALAAALAGALDLVHGDDGPSLRSRCRATVSHLGVPDHAGRTLALYRRALDR